jgi:acid phosphatase
MVAAASRLSFAGEQSIADGLLKPVRFALLGDWGSGDASEMSIAERMLAAHVEKPLDLIVGAGDNIYPNGSADKFASNFERPFAELIKRRVSFHTCFGNHDVRAGADAQLRYPLFNMNGQRFRSVPVGGGTVEFFLLDSNDMDARQVAWLDSALDKSTAIWKVPVFHHPIYSSGSHGSDTALRKVVEPIFVRHGVRVAFSGHDHIYQRVAPQQDVQYFVSGGGGKLREGDINRRDPLVAFGYDSDSHFMVIDADPVSFSYKAVNTRGETIDSGRILSPSKSVASFFDRFRSAVAA